MAGGGGHKKIFQHGTDSSGQEILYLRALRGHSGRNSTDPSLQDKCGYPGQLLRVHLSYRMCNQFTLHHKFRIDTGRTKFGQGMKDSILYGFESHGQESQSSAWSWLDQATLCFVQTEEVEKDTRIRCNASRNNLLHGKDRSSVKQDVMQLSFTIHSQPIVSRKLLWWNLEKSNTRKYMCHLDVSQRFQR